jgi:hypothetical protein
MATVTQEGKAAMLAPLHRLMARMLHGDNGTPCRQALPAPPRGIPEGSAERLPPPDARLHERHYIRDPRTQRFIAIPEPRDHAA